VFTNIIASTEVKNEKKSHCELGPKIQIFI
jgi:hypothetical protein